MENKSLNQNLNEQTNTNMPVPLQVMIQNYQTMINTINSPANQSDVIQANVVNRVGTLYKLFSEFLLPIINTLIDFMKAFISKIGEQDKKITILKENLDIQDHNLRAIGNLLDEVKADLKNTKIQFDKSMKAYHENLDKVTSEHRENLDKVTSEHLENLDKVTSEHHENIKELAEKLKQDNNQDYRRPMSDAAKAMFAGNKTKKHKKHRRKVNK